MKFKIDENLPIEVAGLLRQTGYDVATVLEQDLGGSSDADLANICQKERRVLVTLDISFGDIRAYPPAEFYGLIVLRLKRQDKPYVMHVFSRLIRMFSAEALENRLWIVEEDRIRIRT